MCRCWCRSTSASSAERGLEQCCLLLATAFVAQADPCRARQPRRAELFRLDVPGIEAVAGPGKEIRPEHAEARISPVEQIGHGGEELPIAGEAPARVQVDERIGGQRAVTVLVVLVAARVLAGEREERRAEGCPLQGVELAAQ